MKSLVTASIVTFALMWSAPNATAAWRTSGCSIKEDPAAVAARQKAKEEMDEKLKWPVAAGGVGFVGFAVWQFLRETAGAARRTNRKREPWEMV
jgi:hypothetical protein